MNLEYESTKIERIPVKSTKYVIFKRCVNCNTGNNPANTSCHSCRLLFLEEITYEQYTEHCTILSEKKKLNKENEQ